MNDESKFLAFTIKGRGGPDLYAAFNAHPFKVRGHLTAVIRSTPLQYMFD